MNWLVIIPASIVPMAVGMIYYSKMVVGNAWMKESGVTDDQIKTSNLPLILGISFLFAIMLASSIFPAVIHQMGINSIFAELKDAESQAYLKAFHDKYDGYYRTFKHGALHGLLTSLFMIMPVIGMNALFERRSFKYIFIHTGFFAICFTIMGGIICQWA